VYKGHDKGKAFAARTGLDGGDSRDEISEYEDCRVLGASEACWHVVALQMSCCLPPVLSIPVHLENGQRVVFPQDQVRAAAASAPPKTPLTEWFAVNATLRDGEAKLLYHEMVRQYTWDTRGKVWKKRRQHKNNAFPQIARMHTIHPTAGEAFYLRLLLHNEFSRGKQSFAQLKAMPDGSIAHSYKDVCMHLGLLQDDGEWHAALDDAAVTLMCPQIRAMYVIMLEFCEPSDPISLFHNH